MRLSLNYCFVHLQVNFIKSVFTLKPLQCNVVLFVLRGRDFTSENYRYKVSHNSSSNYVIYQIRMFGRYQVPAIMLLCIYLLVINHNNNNYLPPPTIRVKYGERLLVFIVYYNILRVYTEEKKIIGLDNETNSLKRPSHTYTYIHTGCLCFTVIMITYHRK